MLARYHYRRRCCQLVLCLCPWIHCCVPLVAMMDPVFPRVQAPARTKPVEFEKEDEPDPFGLDQFMESAKTGPDRNKKESYSRDRR